MITKKEALDIINQAREAGLVHKVYHPGSNLAMPEVSLCNCCKDCCEIIAVWRKGALPLLNTTHHLSIVDSDVCIGCGTCEEKCPTEAIRVDDNGSAIVSEEYCFGCGVCAYFCPSEAISLHEGLRHVNIPPPRMR